MQTGPASACAALWRNTDESAAALEKSETSMLVAGQPDACAHLDLRPRAAALQPQPFAVAQVLAREFAPDAQRRAQPARPAGQRGHLGGRIVALHERQAVERLERAYQHAGADACGFGCQVDVEAAAVEHAHVGVAARLEQRRIAGS